MRELTYNVGMDRNIRTIKETEPGLQIELAIQLHKGKVFGSPYV